MYSFIAALTFLTVIPVPKHMLEKSNFEGCQKFFPLVGIIIGIILSIFSYIYSLILPSFVAAALSTVTLIKITGGLHLDGLSDTADGFNSHRDRDQIKRIMKDSCIGSFGSIALICLILIKTAALFELGNKSYLALLLVPVVGRTSILFISHTIKPASQTGLGYSINSGTNIISLSIGLIFSIILATMFFNIIGLLSIILTIATIFLLGKISEKKIGGYTGDVLGACCEISEMITLIVLSASTV